eukprot:m.1642062 g.1642062  ORF g.1642062 m.1642062 type:complete len:501 (+) comp51431_c0_seq1:280-1782(+)
MATGANCEPIGSGYRIGDRVQARVKHDRLFYTGTVTGLSHTDADGDFEDVPKGTTGDLVTVQFDDDQSRSTIPQAWVRMGGNRRILYRMTRSGEIVDGPALQVGAEIKDIDDNDIIVTMAWLWAGPLDETEAAAECGPRPCRLLSFGTSPKVYQSGVIVEVPGARTTTSDASLMNGASEDCVFDWSHIFEPEQALALAVALSDNILRSAVVGESETSADTASSSIPVFATISPSAAAGAERHRTNITEAPDAQRSSLCLRGRHPATCTSPGVDNEVGRVLLVGGGGCTLPMALRSKFGGVLHQDVVEMHQGVIAVAYRSFGLARGSSDIRVVCADGIDFLTRAGDATYDAVLIDACDADAEDGAPLEFPVTEFVDMEFLSKCIFCKLREGGVYAVNVIANATHLAAIAYTLKIVFGNVHVLATDPNYYFYCTKKANGDTSNENITPDQVIQRAHRSGIYSIAQDVLDHDVAKTTHYRDKCTLIGWLAYDEFIERVTREQT